MAISKAVDSAVIPVTLDEVILTQRRAKLEGKRAKYHEEIVRVDIRKSFIFRGIGGVRGAVRFHDAIWGKKFARYSPSEQMHS